MEAFGESIGISVVDLDPVFVPVLLEGSQSNIEDLGDEDEHELSFSLVVGVCVSVFEDKVDDLGILRDRFFCEERELGLALESLILRDRDE